MVHRWLMIIGLSSNLGMLAACSAFDLIKPSSGLSVDTEIVAGDKEEQITTEVGATRTETTNTADNIQQTFNTVNEDYPWWVMVLLVLGWMMPTPPKIWKGIRKFIGV